MNIAKGLIGAALLAAGFLVASGVGTGPKKETTVALTPLVAPAILARHPILPTQWLERWERSDAKFPPSVTPELRPHFESVIRSHPQFGALLV